MEIRDLARYLPHRPPMILLESLLSVGPSRLEAGCVIRQDSLFFEPQGVPTPIGLEYLAQACGLFAGYDAVSRGLPVRIGYLLGARRYVMHQPWFRRDERLTVTVELVYRDTDMANFLGRIDGANGLAVEAQLTVYQPPRAETDGV